MADIGPQLSLELTRIIACPYPPSLSHLADLLANADVLTVRACIHDRAPCEVSRLATLVCEALPLWAYGLRILSSLCQSPHFVDTLLLQNPSLLDALLAKANSSPRDFDEYAGLCVLLLSRPLPGSIPLPASAQAFFLRVLEKARHSPNVCTLKPVYLMLNGACRDLYSLLPADRREHFDQVLSHILSLNGTGQDHMLMLWCFGIVLLVEHSGEHERSQSLHSTIGYTTAMPRKQWKTASGRKVFGSAEKNKMITLTYLSVIFATKGDVGVSDEDAIKGIRIAVCALRHADQKALTAWPTSSAIARGMFAKLPLKVLRSDINPVVQLEALCFYSMVVGEGNLPTELVTQYERCLEDVADVVDTECLGETLPNSLRIYSPQMQQTSFQALLTDMLDACILPPKPHQLSNLKTLVEQMTTVLPSCDSMRTKMWSVVSRSELQRKMWEVVRSKTEQEQVTCRAYGVSLHQQMISATIALLLTLALAVQPAVPAMPLALTIALVDKQKQSSHTPNRCIHDVSHPEHTAVSLYEQKNTPYTGQHLHDWRDRLKSDIESQGSFQRDSIIRSVAQICQDLETRCDTVEEPLRREKEKTLELEQHVDELNERIATLEVQAADDRFHSEGLEDEKLIISDERDSLIAKLKHLEADTDEAIRKADEVLIQIREDFNAKELEHRSTILIYEETTRALEKETEGQHTTIEKLRDDLAHTEHERTVLSEQLESLQQRLSDTENSLNDELHSVLTLSEEIAQLKDRKIELELQLQGTEADLDTMTTRLSDLQVSHQELVQSSEEAYRDIEQRYSSDLDAATVRAQNEREESHTKLQEAIQHGQRIASTHDETRKELQQLQTTIPALTERIQELTEFCSEQEEELEELRTLRKNVLASMGLASQHPLAIRSGSGGQQDAADPPVQTPRVPREHRRRKSALQNLDEAPGASRSTLGATSTAMEFVAKASFASSDSHSSQNGPTPKRSKPRPSSKVPAMQTPYTQKPVLSSRSVSKKLSPIKRSALRQMSPNRRHSTVGFAAPENEDERSNDLCSARKRRGSLQGVEEVDFDMEDFLAGTPLTPGNFATGTGRIPDGDDDDDDDDDATATEL